MTMIKEPAVEASHSMIWMHGLGAAADDMVSLEAAMQLNSLPIRHIFLSAPNRPVTINAGMTMPAWYDLRSERLDEEEDGPGILASMETIHRTIDAEEEQGIKASNIVLAGFSQGGAMALYSGLRYEKPLAGLVCLSGYLLLRNSFIDTPVSLENSEVPIFMAYGNRDPIVLPMWAQMSHALLEEQGLNNIVCQGFDMEHNVIAEEVALLRQWLVSRVA